MMLSLRIQLAADVKDIQPITFKAKIVACSLVEDEAFYPNDTIVATGDKKGGLPVVKHILCQPNETNFAVFAGHDQQTGIALAVDENEVLI